MTERLDRIEQIVERNAIAIERNFESINILAGGFQSVSNRMSQMLDIMQQTESERQAARVRMDEMMDTITRNQQKIAENENRFETLLAESRADRIESRRRFEEERTERLRQLAEERAERLRQLDEERAERLRQFEAQSVERQRLLDEEREERQRQFEAQSVERLRQLDEERAERQRQFEAEREERQRRDEEWQRQITAQNQVIQALLMQIADSNDRINRLEAS